MNNTVIDLSLGQMALSYIFVLVAMAITSLNGLNKNKDLLISTARMTIQLLIAGFVLVYIFDSNSFIFAGLMILFMEASAVYNIVSPNRDKLPKSIIPLIGLAMLVGSLLSLVFFLLVVIRPEPLYNPQYLIPIGGMIMGNSMNGISLSLKQIISSVENNSTFIEGSLMLGASPKDSMKTVTKEAFNLAITPTINSMKNMGLITLPGMMTGQILGGVVPIVAIKYQIAVMTAITSAVTISVFVFLNFAYKHFFNENAQLIDI